MATISLRRTKEKDLVGLPSKTVGTCYIELSGGERELYDQMEAEAKSVVHDFISGGNLMSNYSTVLCIIMRLRQICDDFALCPSDIRSLLPSNNIEGMENNKSTFFFPEFCSLYSNKFIFLGVALFVLKFEVGWIIDLEFAWFGLFLFQLYVSF